MSEAPPTSNTELAVQMGVLQEGNRNILSGIGEIKTTLLGHSEILTRHDIAIPLIDQRVTALEADNVSTKAAAVAKRTPWYQTVTVIFAALAVGAAVVSIIVNATLAHH